MACSPDAGGESRPSGMAERILLAPAPGQAVQSQDGVNGKDAGWSDWEKYRESRVVLTRLEIEKLLAECDFPFKRWNGTNLIWATSWDIPREMSADDLIRFHEKLNLSPLRKIQ